MSAREQASQKDMSCAVLVVAVLCQSDVAVSEPDKSMRHDHHVAGSVPEPLGNAVANNSAGLGTRLVLVSYASMVVIFPFGAWFAQDSSCTSVLCCT